MLRLDDKISQGAGWLACAFVAVAVYIIVHGAWAQYRQYRTFEAARDELSYTPRPDIRDSSILVEALYSLTRKGGAERTGERLVLWVSDAVACLECFNAASTWVELAREITRTERLEVWVATPPAEDRESLLVKELARSSVPFRVLAVREPSSFLVRTGIHMAPAAVLSEGGVVRCAFVGVPDHADVRGCLASLRRGGGVTIRVRGGRTQPWLSSARQ